MLKLPANDMDQLFRRTVFNFLTGVCDDHDKNFSFVLTPDGVWRLSPAYDVTFTVNIQNRFRADHHAMSLENCNRAISTQQFLRLAEHNDINGAKETIELIKDKVLSFETKLSGLGIDDVWKRIIRPYMMTQI